MAYLTKFLPRNPHKYLGNTANIICRSLWERRFAKWCDETPGVLRWGSEEFFIPYVSPVDGCIHRYFPDFFVEVQTRTGKRQFVIEVKPHKQTAAPTVPKRKGKRYLAEAMTFAVNQRKWEAAKDYCKKQKWTFMIVTENELFGTKSLF